MENSQNAVLIKLITKVVDARLKKILPILIEKYINESVDINISGDIIQEMVAPVRKQVQKQVQKSSQSTNRPTTSKNSTSLMEMMGDDYDDDQPIAKSRPQNNGVINDRVKQKLQTIKKTTFVKGNPLLDSLLKQTAAEVMLDPSKQIQPDGGGAGVNVQGAHIVANSEHFGNRELQEAIKSSGVDDTTAQLLSKNYSDVLKKSGAKKPTQQKRRIEPIFDDTPAYAPAPAPAPARMVNNIVTPDIMSQYEEQMAQYEAQINSGAVQTAQYESVLPNMTVPQRPSVNNMRQEMMASFSNQQADIPVEQYLPPELLAELQANDNYSVT